MSGRIRWEQAQDDSVLGYAGTIDPAAFKILWLPGAGDWWLTSNLPGQEGKRHYGDTSDEVKPAAEEWLAEFTASLGAIFPKQPQARGPLDPPQEVLDKMAARGMRELTVRRGGKPPGWQDDHHGREV